ncbi:O-acetyltransferase OatA [Saezia sanguinis]|uniref:O-acetyltransferase OatA n=1 Tax=Saezia sanguinis TaxID=1965230 RepID=A0A433SAE8_9BURK|nr:acyltransferase family protein [Saezia sanguinis]RUS65634.1 O-acetyltransferase OatA [Saezia sanguinis]
MTYKPEIDGLRAVAVLLVLLCHMQLGMAGGFIGVDVFFVISGFLITTIVVDSLSQGKFSFWNFYGRRFVRLYPALIVVVILTFIAGFLLTDPATLENLARTGKYAITSASNFFYYKHQGYFAIAAQKQPFLHTWSLGVEWQFYLVWPLLVWLVFKLPLKCTKALLVALLLVITIASVVASQWALTHGRDSAAYYLMPYRAFELGLGGLLVFIYHQHIKPAAGVVLVIAGLAAILFASVFYTPSTPFPGYYALLPCLGAAACMLGGKTFVQGNVLKWNSVVFIGKASYSIYLVHWPLLVLYKYYVFRDINTVEKLVLLLVSLVLGIVIYLLVEKRINWKRLPNKLVGCLAMAAVVLVVAPVFHYISKGGGGLPWRLNATELNNSDYFEPARAGYHDRSTLGNKAGPFIAVVAGDSFAHSYATGFDEYLSPRMQAVDLVTSPGCMVSGLYYRSDLSAADKADCIDVYQKAIEKSAQYNVPLVLVQSWDNYKIHEFTRLDESGRLHFDRQAVYDDFIRQNLTYTLSQMNGRPLILVATVPYFKIDTSEKECLARPPYVPNQVCTQQILLQYPIEEAIAHHINTLLQEFAQQHPNVYYVDPSLQACPQGICTAQHNAMIYDDGSHLSKYGSRLLTPTVLGAVERIIHPGETP